MKRLGNLKASSLKTGDNLKINGDFGKVKSITNLLCGRVQVSVDHPFVDHPFVDHPFVESVTSHPNQTFELWTSV